MQQQNRKSKDRHPNKQRQIHQRYAVARTKQLVRMSQSGYLQIVAATVETYGLAHQRDPSQRLMRCCSACAKSHHINT